MLTVIYYSTILIAGFWALFNFLSNRRKKKIEKERMAARDAEWEDYFSGKQMCP